MARSSFSRSSLSSSSRGGGGGGRKGVFFFLCCFNVVVIFIAVCCSVDVMMVFASDSSSSCEEGFGEEDEHSVKSFKVSRNLGGSSSLTKEKEEKEKVSSSSSSSSNALLDLASNKKHGEEIQFPLWHSLEYFINDENTKEEGKEEEFFKVGTISGTIVLENNNNMNNEKSSKVSGTKFRLKDVKVHRDEMTTRDKDQLQSLAKKGRKYRIRVPANVLAPSGNAFAQAASPARCVVTSRLRESFTLHMDDSGNVLAVDYDAECPAEVHLLGGGEEGSLGGEADDGGDVEDASLFIADGAQFRSVATARFPKRAPQLNADAAMTDVRGHGGPMDAKKAQEIKTRRARGEKVDATTKELTWFQRNYMWVVPVAYFMFMNMVQEQGGGGGGAPATPATQKKSN